MAIRTYVENGKKLYEVYVNGFDSRGARIQRKRKGIETIQKAKVSEFELKRELALKREEKVPYRWQEWLDVCLKRMKLEYRPSTVINYGCTLGKWINPKWAHQELNQITKNDVYAAIYEDLGPSLSPHSRRTVLKMVKRIFQLAVEEGVLDRNPCGGIQIKVPEVDQKVLTSAEVEVFLREARATNHRFYQVWAMALMTGMRSGELFALKWTDLDLEGRTIAVTKQWTNKNGFGPTKSRRNRVVPISDDLLQFLKEMKLRKSAESEVLLPRIQEWTDGQQATVTREFCAAVGVTPVKFHDLRATFITSLLARGESLARVMAIVGHSELKTTNG
jgi:integrase